MTTGPHDGQWTPGVPPPPTPQDRADEAPPAPDWSAPSGPPDSWVPAPPARQPDAWLPAQPTVPQPTPAQPDQGAQPHQGAGPVRIPPPPGPPHWSPPQPHRGPASPQPGPQWGPATPPMSSPQSGPTSAQPPTPQWGSASPQPGARPWGPATPPMSAPPPSAPQWGPQPGAQPWGSTPPRPGQPPHAAPSGGQAGEGKTIERAHPLTPFLRSWVAFAALAWIVGRDILEGGGLRSVPLFGVAGIVIGVALLAGLAGIAGWWFTRFIADEDELRIESGIVFKQSRRIAYTRIQSVDVVQPLAARLFGLAEVRIDAGAGAATKLAFLTRDRAYRMRDELMSRAHGRTADPAAPVSGVFADVSEADEILYTLPPKELALGIALSHELYLTIAFFLVPPLIVSAIGWVAQARGADSGIPTSAFGVLAAGLLIPLGFAVVNFIYSRVRTQYNFLLAKTAAGLRISAGLTSLTSQTVPVRRIQSVRIRQPILWRLAGRYRVDLEILGSANAEVDSSNLSSVLLPIGRMDDVATVLRAVWPGHHVDQVQIHTSPRRARWFDPLTWRWNGFGSDDLVMVTRDGWLTRTQSVIPHARMQSVRISQGPIDRRLNLADLEAHTTGLVRTNRAIHADADAARAFLLEQADRSRTARSTEVLEGSAGTPAGDGHRDDGQAALPWDGPQSGTTPTSTT